MNPVITVAAGLLLSTGASAQTAQPTNTAKQAGGQRATKAVEAGTHFQQEVTLLEQKVLAGEVPTEAFAQLKEEVRGMGESTRGSNPKATELARRLARRISSVEQRAKQGAATKDDFSILREQMIDARVDNAIARLADPAQASPASPQDLERLGSLLEARAAAAGQLDAQAAQDNQKLVRSLNALQKKSGEASLRAVDFAPLKRSLAESRLDRAMTDLEERSLSNTVSLEDYTRVKEVLADRTETLGTPDAAALEKRMQNALEKLKAKAASGELTHEEFAKVRADIVDKARAAGNNEQE